MKLTPKQSAFCREYLADLNATQAAIRAGYAPKSARKTASLLLAREDVQASVGELMREREQRTDITADRVLRELSCVAFALPVAKVERGRVTIDDTSKLSQEALRSISELSESMHGLKVRQHDKVRALELIGRHLGLFPSQVELSGRGGGPVELAGHLSDEQLEAIIHDAKAG